MTEFELQELASPNSRSGKLKIAGKEITTPTYFPSLTRKSEPEKLVETFTRLNGGNEQPLPNLGGFRVESQLAPSILDGIEESTQFNLNMGHNISGFSSIVDHLDRLLIVDPNTDRLFYSIYRKNGLPDISEYVPDAYFEIKDALEADDEDDGWSITHSQANHALRERVSRPNLAESFLNLQTDYSADIYLPPYYPLGEEATSVFLEENIELFEITQSLSDRLYNSPSAPVIALKSGLLNLDGKLENGRWHPPDEWIQIIREYRELNPEVLFVKVTNMETNPDTLDKSESEGLFNFFRLLRRFTEVPTFLLGADEFAYILMSQGLDGYSQPLYKSPYQKPIRGGSGNNGPNHRKFIVPREWGWPKFDQLETLGCNGPFCKEWNGSPPEEIPLSDQDDLRIKHWLWLRDDELRQISESISEDSVRPGLQSICEDSEWKKNFTLFL